MTGKFNKISSSKLPSNSIKNKTYQSLRLTP